MALTKFNYNSFDLTTAASKGLAFNSSANGFETAAEGSMTLIKTLTASSSATVQFLDGTSDVVLDNTYPVYLIKIFNAHPATNNVTLQFQVNASGGSGFNETITSTSFRSFHTEDDNYTGLEYQTGSDQAQGTSYQRMHGGNSNANDSGACAKLFLFNPSSTTFVKHFIGICSLTEQNPAADQAYIAGYINTTSAIDEISFQYSSGNIDSGTFKLYGIKDS